MNTELALPVFFQDPEDKVDYNFRLVSDDADTWATSGAPVISPSGMTSPSIELDGTNAKIWLQSGTDEQDYEIRVPLTSTLGRVDNVKFIVKVRR